LPEGKSLSRFRLRRALDKLSSKEGRGTELISLYVPPGRQISDVVNNLRQEYGTASNIKSTTTRKHVQDAIVKVMQRIKLFKRPPPNGLVIFCGAIPRGPPGSEVMEIYSLIPPAPISTYLYRCDSRFHTEILEEMLREEDSYGILLVDTSGATFAVLRGKRLNVVREITSGIPGKHRAGGQSARRFERLREMGVNEFFRRVSEHANEIFLQLDDLKGILLGGPGPTKYEFREKNKMHYKLKGKILAVLDTAYIGKQGVKEILEKSPEIIRDVRYMEEKNLIQDFLYEIGHDTGLAIYGHDEVMKSLKEGSIKTLLLSEGLDAKRVELSCSSCGKHYERILRNIELIRLEEDLEKEMCPNCGNLTLSIIQKIDLIDLLADLAEEKNVTVEIISTETEEGSMLLKSFGGVAAILSFISR